MLPAQQVQKLAALTKLTDHACVLSTLLTRTAKGDQAAFRILYDSVASRLFAICIRIVRDRSLAEDVLQESFVRIWERARQFDETRGSALTWMISVTRNHAIDVVRSRNKTAAVPLEMPEDLTDPAAQQVVEDRAAMISAAHLMAGLDENVRKAIVLAYRYGMTIEELAQVLDVPLGTAKSWVRRGLAKLRDKMDEKA